MRLILSSTVFWSFDYEVYQRDEYSDAAAHFSGVAPFHCHTGKATLTSTSLVIEDDINLNINLSNWDQLYLGFNEVYPRTLVKNFGIFRDPLRLKFFEGGKLTTI